MDHFSGGGSVQVLEAYPGATVEFRPITPMPPPVQWPPKPRLPRDWQDLDGWRAVLAYTRTLEQKRWTVGRWVAAAGGQRRAGQFHLPDGLPRGLALADLKAAIRMVAAGGEISTEETT